MVGPMPDPPGYADQAAIGTPRAKSSLIAGVLVTKDMATVDRPRPYPIEGDIAGESPPALLTDVRALLPSRHGRWHVCRRPKM